MPVSDDHPGFDEFAEDFAYHAAGSAYNAWYDRPAVHDLMGEVAGRRVLDAGCGPGLYAEELAARGAEVVAFDSGPKMVELARQRLGDRALVRVHDLSDPLDWLDDDSFDAALMALVIHHLDDRVAPLREIHRVLRPGGHLVVSTHHPTSDWLSKVAATSISSRSRRHGAEAGECDIGACRSPLSATSSPRPVSSSNGWWSRDQHPEWPTSSQRSTRS